MTYRLHRTHKPFPAPPSRPDDSPGCSACHTSRRHPNALKPCPGKQAIQAASTGSTGTAPLHETVAT